MSADTAPAVSSVKSTPAETSAWRQLGSHLAARPAGLRRAKTGTEPNRAEDRVVDLREPTGRRSGVQPPSTYGYDPILPPSWREGPRRARQPRRRETPATTTRGPLPRRFRLLRSYPPLQRVVHHGPIDGADVDVKLTMLRSMRLHSTGIEHPLRDLDGRLCEAHHLRLLVDAFGRDRRSLGTNIVREPSSLAGAKREWHMSIVARARHGFAIADDQLVVLEYLSPERDIRRRDFGIAYKRIVVAYQIDVIRA